MSDSPDLVYFSSVSENTKRFVERLDRPAVRIPLRPKKTGMIQVSHPYVLIVPTYGGGSLKRAVPKQVIAAVKQGLQKFWEQQKQLTMTPH